VLGTRRASGLPLARRLVLNPARFSHGKVTLTGQIVGPLTKPIAPIVVTQQTSCAQSVVVKTVRPRRNGRFRITLSAPAGAVAAFYQLHTKVRRSERGRRRLTTYSLPEVVAIRS